MLGSDAPSPPIWRIRNTCGSPSRRINADKLPGRVALVFPPAGLTIAGGAVVAITLAGAGFGAWTATMIGIDVPNTRLKRFEQAIERGELLMMIDVARDRVEEIEQMIKLHHA